MIKKTLVTMLLSSFAVAASAHQVWVERDASGPAKVYVGDVDGCLLYTSPSPRDKRQSRMPSSA